MAARRWLRRGDEFTKHRYVHRASTDMGRDTGMAVVEQMPVCCLSDAAAAR